MVPRLGAHPESPFPPVESALEEPDGLLAWGGALEPQRLLNAYRQGIFPWYSEDQPILWWSPSKRCVLEPSGIYVSKRLNRLLRQDRFKITADHAFGDVLPDPGGSVVIHPLEIFLGPRRELEVHAVLRLRLDGCFSGITLLGDAWRSRCCANWRKAPWSPSMGRRAVVAAGHRQNCLPGRA